MSPHGKDNLIKVLTSFAEDVMSKTEIVQSEWPSSLEQILGSWKEKHRCGFNLTLQIIFGAYMDLLEDRGEKKKISLNTSLFAGRGDVSKTTVFRDDVVNKHDIAKKRDVTKDRSFVPDTMDLDLLSNHKKVKVRLEDSTCRWVPETQLPVAPIPVEVRQSDEELFKTPEQVQKHLSLSVNTRKKHSPQKVRDLSEKYSPLTCLTREPAHESTMKLGALGTGSIHCFAPQPTSSNPIFIADSESPSIIKSLNLSKNKGDVKKVRPQERKSPNEEKATNKISRHKLSTTREKLTKKKSPKKDKLTKRKSPNFDIIDDYEEDDFKIGQKMEQISKTKVAVSSSPPLRSKDKKSKSSDEVTVLNRFGLYVEKTTASQKKRNASLKQQGIMKYTVPSGDATDAAVKRDPIKAFRGRRAT